jgi:hypothetical protein
MENPTSELAAMERRWNERIANQKAAINRLMKQRQDALDILNKPQSMMCAELKRTVIAALNGEGQ